MSKLKADKLNQSTVIQQSIKALVAEVAKASQTIEGPQPTQSGLETTYQQAVDQIGVNRGRPLFYPYIGSGLGHGPYVELSDGSVKLDLINGIGIHIMGHSHPQIIEECLRGSLADIVMQGNLQPNSEYKELGQKLLDIAGRGSRLANVWITTSGSRANENALKACRQKVTPARKVITFEAAFAGRTTMMTEISDNPAMRQGLPTYNEVLRIPFYDKNISGSAEKSVEKFKEIVSHNESDICCFMFEPMLGEGGYNYAPREFFMPILDFCRQKDIPVFVDEIQTFCRTGEFFAFQKLDIGDYVDVVSVAKTLQCAATLFTKDFNPKPGLMSGTFAGSTPALRAGLKILNFLDSGSYMGSSGQIEQIHQKFIAMLNELNQTTCKGLLQDAGGMGLMIAVTPLDGSREKMLELLKALYKNGILTFGCGRGPFRIRFLLPAILEDEHIEVAKKIIEQSVLELA